MNPERYNPERYRVIALTCPRLLSILNTEHRDVESAFGGATRWNAFSIKKENYIAGWSNW